MISAYHRELGGTVIPARRASAQPPGTASSSKGREAGSSTLDFGRGGGLLGAAWYVCARVAAAWCSAVHSAGRFAAAAHRAVSRGGSLLIPAQAVGQAEVLLTELRTLIDTREIPPLPVVLDSPAGLAAVEVCRRGEPQQGPDLRGGLSHAKLPENLVPIR